MILYVRAVYGKSRGSLSNIWDEKKEKERKDERNYPSEENPRMKDHPW